MLCGQDTETVEHVIIECTALQHIRRPILEAFCGECETILPQSEVQESLVQLVLDPSRFLSVKKGSQHNLLETLNRQSKRLCQALLLERYKRLALVPTRKERKGMGRLGRSTYRTERRVLIEIFFLNVNRVVERSHFSPCTCTYHQTYLEVKLKKTPLGDVPFMAESIRNSNSMANSVGPDRVR